MFQSLKTKNQRQSKWKDIPSGVQFPSSGYSHAPLATTFTLKGNEASRLVRCRVCGFICDKERDGRAKTGSWAGFGITQGAQLTAGTSIGDKRVPAPGSVSTSPDKYYDRVITGGCPCCATLNYDDYEGGKLHAKS
jgi:hypothetical protein